MGVGGRQSSSRSSLVGQLVEGWRSPWRVFGGLLSASSLMHTFSIWTPGRSPQHSVSVPRASATSPKTWCLLSWGPSALPSTSRSSWSAGRGLHTANGQGSRWLRWAFPKSAEVVGRCRTCPGRHSWLELPGGGLRWSSVILALALQFQAFLELGRIPLPCKAPHTALLFSRFWLSVHGAVGVPGWGRGWGQVHLRLLQHGGHIQLMGTERGDRDEVTCGARLWHTLSPYTLPPELCPSKPRSFLLHLHPEAWPSHLPSCSWSFNEHLRAPRAL